MVLNFRENFGQNSRNLLRECGYNEIFDRKTGKTSFVRKLRGDFYPRYHVYVNKDEPGWLQLNMHLDMKKPTYEGFTAHSGEYSGELVEREAERIKQTLAGFTQSAMASRQPAEEPKKPFWRKIFGGGDDQ